MSASASTRHSSSPGTTPPADGLNDRDASGWSANAYRLAAAFVFAPAQTAPVLELLDAQRGERIADLGCGSGEVTLEVVRKVGSAAEGLVVGVDVSESMVSSSVGHVCSFGCIVC